jgi:hypothetical protein
MEILFESQPDKMLLKAIVLEGHLASRRVLEKYNFRIEPLKNSLRSTSTNLESKKYSQPTSATTDSRMNEDTQSSTKQYESDIDEQNFIFYTYRRPESLEVGSNY